MNSDLRWLEVSLVHPCIVGGVYVVRFLNEATEVPFAPFSGVCTVNVTATTAAAFGMLGIVHRQHLRALLAWLLKQGVETLRAHRAPMHKIPGGRIKGEWTTVDLVAMERRL